MNEKTMSLPFGGLQVVEESGVALNKQIMTDINE